MRFSDWKPLYQQILADFGYDAGADVEAARRLDSIVGSPSAASRRLEVMRGTAVTVVGPAIRRHEVCGFRAPAIVADSAISLLPGDFGPPFAIVTDLDGDAQVVSRFSSRGAVTVVHAHGDNIHRLDAVKDFRGPVLGTCQCEPFGKLRNFGGFTDGDRAAFLAEAFGAESVDLVGFDFDNPVPKAGSDAVVKRRKLAWARRLLGSVGIPVTVGGRPLV